MNNLQPWLFGSWIGGFKDQYSGLNPVITEAV